MRKLFIIEFFNLRFIVKSGLMVIFSTVSPFVPMMVVALKNKRVLIVGLGAGIVGYALGNHFGVIMQQFLSSL